MSSYITKHRLTQIVFSNYLLRYNMKSKSIEVYIIEYMLNSN